MGLVARALEQNGIATTMTSWNSGIARRANPPRTTLTQLARGATLGNPNDTAQQLRVLRATLDLLSQPAPLEPVKLDES